MTATSILTSPGAVIYAGPSRLDRQPIVAVVTFRSLNEKTGDIAQAWMLRADIEPTAAIKDGRDRSVCGECVHRSGSNVGRSCYVIPWLGPLNVWRAYRNGLYPRVSPAEASHRLAGGALRLGAYGDPAAVPFDIWRQLLTHVPHWIGYTHQWRVIDQRFRQIVMASVESDGEVSMAHSLGWRTFRTRLADESLRADEIVCPASDEAGHRVTCEACGLCRGQARRGAKSIAIIAHGQRVRWFADRKAAVERSA